MRCTRARLLASLAATLALTAGCGGSDSDGNTTTGDTSNTGNAAPVVAIDLPQSGAIVAAGQAITFTGSVSDDRDAPDALKVLWTSNREAAPLSQTPANSLGGTTIEVADLAPGEHVITLGATDSGGKVGTAKITITVNNAPGAPEVSISPPSPKGGDDLVASVTRDAVDPNRESSALRYSYRWFKNGAFANVTGATVAAALTEKGDVWEVRVVANDGYADGAEGVSSVTVGNSPPVCSGAAIFPTAANTTKDISCSCTGWTDPDGDTADDRCAFFDGATALGGDGACTLPASATDKGMEIHCVLTPNDGTSDGAPVTSASVPVINAPPTAPTAALTPTTVDATTTVACSLASPGTDPDGDSLTYEVAWRVDGFENTGVTQSSVTAGALRDSAGQKAKRGSRLSCQLRASDGAAQSAPAVSPEVVLVNASPTVDNVLVTSVGGAAINENAVLSCQAADVADPDGDTVTLSFVWYVAGVEVAGATGQNLTGQYFAKGQSVSCAARGVDGQGGQSALASAKNSVTIGNALPSLLGATLDKTAPSAYEAVTCIPAGWVDPDGDPLEVSYAWFELEGTTLTALAGQVSNKITPEMLVPGDKLVCQVTPKNGLELGLPVQSAPATIVPPSPTAPVVTVAAPEGAAGAVRCDFVEPAKHFTGTVTYTFFWRLNGGAENAGNATITGLHDCDMAACRAVATNGTTTLSSAPASLLLPVGDDCDTGNDCQTPTCKPAGGCDFVMASDIACDDGNACTTGDSCELGFCVAGGFATQGAACSDGKYCTGTDTCNGAGACVGGASPCQSAADSCLVGSCDELEDKCIVATKPANTPCNDQNGCTTGDVCSANGACLPGAPVTCTQAGDQCNAAACKSLGPNDHSCELAPKPAGAACTTGDFCTTGEVCNGQGACTGGDERDCDAEIGDDCNTAYCDPTLQRCLKVPAPQGTLCSDGNACTVVDTCQNGFCEGTGNACVEEQVSLAQSDQRPTVVSIGFGRYAAQWWQTSAAPTALRYSDAYGSRENEEFTTPSSGRPAAWDTRMAARATGTIAVPYFSGAVTNIWGCSCYSCGAYGQGIAADMRGIAHDLAGSRLTDGAMFSTGFSGTGCNSQNITTTAGRIQSIALLDGSFAFVTSANYNGVPGSPSFGLDPRVIYYYPPTGLMTTGSRVALVGGGDTPEGLIWDAKPSGDGTGTFLLAWANAAKTAILVRRYTSTGQPDAGSSNPWTIYTAPSGTVESVRILGFSDSKFAVVFDVTNVDGSGRGVYGALYDEGANALVSPFRVNTQTTGDQRVGEIKRFSNNDFVVVFDDQNGDSNGWGVKARLYSATGAPKGGVMDVNTITAGTQYLPAVEVLDTDEWVVAWVDGNKKVWTRRYLASGGPSMGRIEWQLNSTTEGGQKNVTAARIGGSALVAYESPVYGKDQGEILVRLVTTTGPTVGSESQVNQYDPGPQLKPAVSAGANRYAVVWESGLQDGSAEGVYARFYTTAGDPVGAELRVNNATTGFQRNPSVAMSSADNAVVAWGGQSSVAGSTSDVFMRIVAATGTYVTGDVQVNTTTDGIQDKPAVAVGPDGKAVIAWQSAGQDGSGYGIYLRKFDATGNATSAEVVVNTQVDLDQKTPAIAVDATGARLTVCWESLGQDVENSLGVYCQVMDYQTLAKIASEVQIAAVKNGEQRNPEVAYLPNGEIIVGWDSEGVDSDRFAVQYRRLTALGVPTGPRTVANRSWAGSQEKPTLVPLSGSGLLVLWEASDQDGSDKGLYFRVMSTF